MYEHILYDVKNHILTITLNRPDRLNAFTHTMIEELIHAFDRADGDDDVRVIIVTGAGRAFCAGADLSAGGSAFDATARAKHAGPEAHRDGGGLVSLSIYECLKPVIAAINGPAVGVGVTMTLPMDIRLASDKARFRFCFFPGGALYRKPAPVGSCPASSASARPWNGPSRDGFSRQMKPCGAASFAAFTRRMTFWTPPGRSPGKLPITRPPFPSPSSGK